MNSLSGNGTADGRSTIPAIPKVLTCIFEMDSPLWDWEKGATYSTGLVLLDAVSAIENVGNIIRKKTFKKWFNFFSMAFLGNRVFGEPLCNYLYQRIYKVLKTVKLLILSPSLNVV